jgi:filamentous hemagglutinin family protein
MRLIPLCALPTLLFALPQGMQSSQDVVANSAAKHLEITSAHERTALDWKSFSIAADEAVRFNLPSHESAILNNVTGGELSQIMGHLESNGRVYLINPQGIIVGKDASIHVGALIASTLRLSNEDFFKGTDYFKGEEAGSILNLGTIQATSGDVHVLAYHVENHGAIQADNATLTAATEAWLQPSSNKKVLIKTSVDGQEAMEEGVVNTGTIEALQTELDADGNVYKFAINHSGTITSLKNEGGKVYIRAEKGCAKLTGEITAPAGHVEVLAERIGVDEAASIDVSSNTTAGEILLGGDWMGQNTPFHAEHTYVSPDARLKADGLLQGNGGKIVVWGNTSARAFGRITTRGGELAGNGGRIEISRVPYFRAANLSTYAPVGENGTVLIDPATVTISTSATSAANVSETGGNYAFSNAGPWNIEVNAIETLLASSDVIINAGNGSATGGDGSITVQGAISWDSGSQLSLQAAASGTITINANITASDPGAALSFAGPVAISNSSGTDLLISVPTILSTNGSAITVTNSGSGTTGIVDIETLGSATNDQQIGDITVTNTGSGVAKVENAAAGLTITSTGQISVETSGTGGNAYIGNAPNADRNVTVAQADGGLSVTNSSSTSDASAHIGGTGANSDSLTTSGPVTIENSGGGAWVRFDGGIDIGSASAPSSGGVSVETSNGNASLSSQGVINIYTTDSVALSSTGSRNATLSASAGLTIGRADGGVSINQSGGSGETGIINSKHLNIYTAGAVSLMSSGVGGQAVIRIPGDITIGQADGGVHLAAAFTGPGNDDASTYFQATSGSVIINTKGSVTLENASDNFTGIYAALDLTIERADGGVSIIANSPETGNLYDLTDTTLTSVQNLTINTKGGVSVVTSNDGLNISYIDSLLGDVKIQAGDAGVRVINSAKDSDSSAAISASGTVTVETTGPVVIENGSNGEYNFASIGGYRNFQGWNFCDVAITRADGGLHIKNHPPGSEGRAFIGDFLTQTNGGSLTTAGPVVIENSGGGSLAGAIFDGGIQIGSPGGHAWGDVSISNSATGAQSTAYLRSAQAIEVYAAGNLTVQSSSANHPAALTGGSVAIVADQSLHIGGQSLSDPLFGSISSENGDLTLVAGDTLRVEGLGMMQSKGSITIAVDQAQRSPGRGHVVMGPNTRLDAGTGGQLRIFTSFFENNIISPDADLNGGTFSGQKDVTDANNIYNVFYNPSRLPAAYSSPYTFYYEALTPKQLMSYGIAEAFSTLSSTMVSSTRLSSESALTLLARLRKQAFLDGGLPYKYGWTRCDKSRSACPGSK